MDSFPDRTLGLRDNSGGTYELSAGTDLNGDGVDDLLVGAPFADNDKGVVYLLVGDNGPGGPVDPPMACSVDENFDAGGAGWVPSSASTCTTGAFVLGTPSRRVVRVGGETLTTQVGGDHTSGNAWFTAFNTSRGKDDVDDGTCVLDSPMWPVDEDSNLSLWYFHGQKDSGDDDGDFFALDISTDGGTTFTPLVSIGDKRNNAAWTRATTAIPAGSKVTISLQFADGASNNDLIEGGLDDIKICPSN